MGELSYLIPIFWSQVRLEEGDGVIIVDMGGGTIDFSTFSHSGNHNAFEEIAAPQCKMNTHLSFIAETFSGHFKSLIFVTIHA